MTLSELFPDEDYRFKMRFRQGAIKNFFASAEHESRLEERNHWLVEFPTCYSAFLDSAEELLDETLAIALDHQTLSRELIDRIRQVEPLRERGLALGRHWEPDYLLLAPNSLGELQLLGGCVCFPSSWRLSEKIGRPLSLIHAIVPGLNDSIGGAIAAFLRGLRPGTSWERVNWGLSRSAELNQHPDRNLPRLDENARLDEVWLRVEHQSLVALPRSGGLLFGIRIVNFSLTELKGDRGVAPRFLRALRTMPEPMARYKGLLLAKERLIQLLEE